MSLRLQTALALAAAILVVSLAIGMVVSRIAADRLESDIGNGLAELAFQMADKLDREMWTRSGEVRMLTAIDALRTSPNPEQARALIESLQDAIPAFSWIGLLSADGTVVAATGAILEGENIAHRPVFKEGIRDRFVGDVHDAVLLEKLLPNPSGEPMKFVDIAYPLRDESGAAVGVLAAHLSWAWAREVRTSLLANAAERRDVSIYIVAADDTVLLADTAEETGQKLHLSATRSARQTGESGWILEEWPDGLTYVTGYASADGHLDFDGFGWTVLTRQSAEQAFAPITDLAQRITAWGFGLALVIATLGWVGMGLLTRPLGALAAAADRIRAGDASEFPRFNGPAEIASLSSALHRLVNSLHRTEVELDRMEDAAYHDRLTGLPNRMALDIFFETAIPRAQRDGKRIALLYIDLDDFKPVNDTMGHATGDAVLYQVGERLTAKRRGGEIAARLGGDEFVLAVFVDADTARQEAEKIAGRIIEAIGEPFSAEGHTARIGCSIGIAFLPGDAQNVSDLFDLADGALYRAKDAGKNCYTFAQDANPGESDESGRDARAAAS